MMLFSINHHCEIYLLYSSISHVELLILRYNFIFNWNGSILFFGISSYISNFLHNSTFTNVILQWVLQAAVQWRGLWHTPYTKQEGQNLAVHKSIEISWRRESPWGAYNTKDLSRKYSRGGWADHLDISKAFQWCKRSEEVQNIDNKWGNGKIPNKTKIGWCNTPLKKCSKVNATNSPRQLSKWLHQPAITPRKSNQK